MSPVEHRRALDPGFAQRLRGMDLDLLDQDDGSIVGLWPDLRIGYTNAGWARFAAANDGLDVLARWPLGASIATAIPAELRRFFDHALAAARVEGPPVVQEYECSSATEWRLFAMQIYGLDGGYLITHSLRQARPHAAAPAPPIEALYRDEHDLVVQCSHCRRMRRAAPPERWDWVPEFVARMPPRTSHGLCPVCFGHYYPSHRDR
jgi:hypothetical protein